MNKIFRIGLLLTLLIPSVLLAQPVTVDKRNDLCATTLQGTNGQNVPGCADAQGRRGILGWVYGRTANPTPVANGTPIAIYGDKSGRPAVVQQQIRELTLDTGVVTLSASTAETTFLAAGATGVFHDLTSMWCVNTSATVVRIDVRDATGGTVRFPLEVPPTDMRGIAISVPINQTTAANNWTIQSSASVTDVRCFGKFIKNL